MEAFIQFFSNHLLLCATTLVVLIFLIIIEWIRTKRNIFSVNPIQAIQMINQENAIVIDMREKEAYQNGHIIRSLSISADGMASELKKLDKHRSKPIIIVTQQPHLAHQTAARLLKQGFKAYSLSGGINAWIQAELPLVKE